MPNFELTAEGAISLIEQLSEEEFDKLCDAFLMDEDEPNTENKTSEQTK